MKINATTTLSLVPLLLALCLPASVLVDVQQANAQVTYTGDTTPEPGFNRPDCPGAVPSTCVLHPTTTNTRFKSDVLVIGSSGDYTISSTQDNWDGVMLLYQRNAFFDENNPLTNLIGFNDDGINGVGSSDLAGTLPNSGANIAAFYEIVMTGFDNNAFGAYTNTVTGPAGGLILVSDGTNLTDDLEGNTSAGPVWNRPDCPTANADPTSLATCTVSSGLSPRFNVHNFTPSCEGPFFLFSVQDYDGFLMLYEGSFDPTKPLENLVAYNDDWPEQGATPRISAFLVRLKANTKYFFVNTGFNNNSAGNYAQVILGPQGCAVATAAEDALEVPDTYELSEVYPNPFNPQAQFTLAVRQAQQVVIDVYDVLGRQVETLHNGVLAPGTQHQFTFDAATLPSGLYVIRAQGDTFSDTRRAFLVK